jgi:hypothetical protein
MSIFLACACGFAGGLLSNTLNGIAHGQVEKDQPKAKQDKEVMPEKLITADGFAMRDAKGRVRIAITMKLGETPGIYFFDEKGVPRIMLSENNNKPCIALYDSNIKPRAEMFEENGVTGFRVKDKNGEGRAYMGLAKENPVIAVTNNLGKMTWWAP